MSNWYSLVFDPLFRIRFQNRLHSTLVTIQYSDWVELFNVSLFVFHLMASCTQSNECTRMKGRQYWESRLIHRYLMGNIEVFLSNYLLFSLVAVTIAIGVMVVAWNLWGVMPPKSARNFNSVLRHVHPIDISCSVFILDVVTLCLCVHVRECVCVCLPLRCWL